MDFDVIVVGGGPVGAAFALALSGARARVALVEARPPLPAGEAWDSRVYAVSPGSVAMLERCDAWRHCDPTRIGVIEDMRVHGDDPRAAIGFSAYESGLRELASTVEAGRLQQALWQPLRAAAHVTLVAPAACRALTLAVDAARLELEDGRVLEARLLVAADGADSWARAQAGLAVESEPYAQRAVVANFESEKAHHGVAYQWFRPDGVLALLPLPGKRVSMVWSADEERAAQLLAAAPDVLAGTVAAAAYGTLGALSLLTPPAAFALRLQRVRQTVLPRFALIGDAAHHVHPLAGQGVNLGLRDARELARVIAQRGAHEDCGEYALLRRYERARREDVAGVQFATDTLQRLFSGRRGALLRNAGLRCGDRLPWLKNWLTQRAAA